MKGLVLLVFSFSVFLGWNGWSTGVQGTQGIKRCACVCVWLIMQGVQGTRLMLSHSDCKGDLPKRDYMA
jgi:hypothetical protein